MDHKSIQSKFAVLAAGAALFASAVSVSHAAAIAYEGTLTNGVTATGNVASGSFSNSAVWDYWMITGSAGDVVTITLNRSNGDSDPGVALFFGLGADSTGAAVEPPSAGSDDGTLTYLTDDDDGGTNTPPGTFFNSLISGFFLPFTGTYTIAAYDLLGTVPGGLDYSLTVSGFNAGGTLVPEPGSLALLGLGLAGLALRRRRQS